MPVRFLLLPTAVLLMIVLTALLRSDDARATTPQRAPTGHTKVVFVDACDPLYAKEDLLADIKGDVKTSQMRRWSINGPAFAAQVQATIESLLAQGYGIQSVMPIEQGLARSIERNAPGWGSGAGMGMSVTHGALVVGIR